MCHPVRGVECVLVLHRHHFVVDIGVQVPGHESGADALQGVRALDPAGENRGCRWLYGHYLQTGLALLQHSADAGDRPARADPGDEDVDLAVSVRPDLFASGPGVDGRIGGVFELLRHVERALALGDLLCLGDGPAHAVGPGREDQLGAIAAQQHPPLFAHGLRHGEDAAIPSGGAHHGQGDAGITAGRLDHRRARLQQPRLFGGVDHRNGDPVLDAPRRVEELELCRDRGAGPVTDVAEAHQRGTSDELGDVVRDPHCVTSWVRRRTSN